MPDFLSLPEKIEFLKAISLFSDLPQERLAEMAAVMEEKGYPADSFLCREGEPGDRLYLILSGGVSLVKEGIHLGTFRRRGDCVGEMALLDQRPRSASLIAADDLHVLQLHRDDFEAILDQTPQVSRGLFKMLSSRLREDLTLRIEAIRQEAARAQELKLAADVQRSLLPHEELHLPYLRTAGYCEPAHTVGGDYYDYLPLSPERVGVVIGDVMGHGFHSALFVAMLKSCLQTQIRQAGSVPKVISSVHQTIEHAQTGIYLSLCYFVIDARTQTLSYANAGHPFPYHYHRRTRRLELLESTCLPLGMMPDIPLPRRFFRRRPWSPGDLLLLYSDGVTEAENLHEEFFGEPRLRRVFLANVDRPAEDIRAAILDALTAYCQDKPRTDDVTLIVLQL